MFRRGKRTLAMAPVVPLPTGNVMLVTACEPDLGVAVPSQREAAGGAALPETEVGPDGASIGWSIRHSDGEIVRSNIATRADASRLLGSLAAHGVALPLVVHAPDGRPIGERLG